MTADIISDVLQAVRLTGAIFFDIAVRPPWAAEAPAAAELAPLLMPGAQRVIEYHVVTHGACFARIVGEADSVPLHAGSIVVFPQGHPHVLSSQPALKAPIPDRAVYHRPYNPRDLPLRFEQGQGEVQEIRVICGFLGCDARPFNPLVESLPKILHVPDGYDCGDGWLGNLIKATLRESQEKRVGSASILPRLSELIFIEVVRRHMEQLPADATGWFGALRDPQVGCAIRLMHEAPQQAWTLASLAKAAAASRSLLVERFSRQVGMAPMTYLMNWRMQLAAGMLARDASNVARIACAVGYESEAAFSRAFKRCAGLSPAAWRAQTRAAAEARPASVVGGA